MGGEENKSGGGSWGPFKAYPKEGEESTERKATYKRDTPPKDEKDIGKPFSKGNMPKEEEKPAEGKPKNTVSIGPIYEKKVAGAVWTTKKTAEDKSFVSLGHGEAGVEVGKAAYDIDEKKAELTVVEGTAKFSVAHGEVDFIDAVQKLFGIKKKEAPKATSEAPPSAPSAGGGPMAARVTDLTAHGTPLVPGAGSPNVLIGNLPAWRALADMHLCPMVKGVVPDVGGVVLKGSPTVLINFMMACRVGDMVVEIPGGPNPIVMGCPTVMIGDGGGAGGSAGDGGEKKGKEPPPNVKGDLTGSVDVGTAEVTAELGAAVDLKKGEASAKAEIGGMVAAVKGELKGSLKFRIPFTEHYVGIGAGVEGSAASLGGKVGGQVLLNKTDPATGKKLWKVEGGAKAAAGLGLGVNFSLIVE